MFPPAPILIKKPEFIIQELDSTEISDKIFLRQKKDRFMNNLTELTDETFDQWLIDNPNSIVDFWAPWCGPCKSFAPSFEAESKLHETIAFGKVNADEQQKIAKRLHIRSLPTLIGFRNGQVENTQIGAVPLQVLRKQLEQLK